MTYIADLDPESPARAAEQAFVETWDALMPDWAERSLPREDQRFIPENDVLNPDETIIWGYGGDHRAVLSVGRHEPDDPWN